MYLFNVLNVSSAFHLLLQWRLIKLGLFVNKFPFQKYPIIKLRI